jgi:hypothetical protein
MEIKDLKVGDEIWYFHTKEGNSLNEKDGRNYTVCSKGGDGTKTEGKSGGTWVNITTLMEGKKGKSIICLYTDNEGNLFSSSDEKIGILFPKVAKP